MASAQISAFITYHKPGTQPPLYVAGTFSNPPWQPCEMDHTTRPDGEYDFKKEVRAEPGTKIHYKFRINDGDWVLNDDEPTVTDSSGNTNHVLEVKPQTEYVQTAVWCQIQQLGVMLTVLDHPVSKAAPPRMPKLPPSVSKNLLPNKLQTVPAPAPAAALSSGTFWRPRRRQMPRLPYLPHLRRSPPPRRLPEPPSR